MRIVNIRTYSPKENEKDRIVYIGRENKAFHVKKSPLYNPFVLKRERQRSLCVNMYKEYVCTYLQLRKRFNFAEEMYNAFLLLSYETILVCWCAPKLCHGSIIEKIWKEQFL